MRELTNKQILIKYWGYSSFRPLQEEIIDSVISGNDTLALLPTGGGKSVCFQIPALAKEGICIVVSPLIALMKDQVDNLKQKGIKATAIYSGMKPYEIDIAIDNCIYGGYKFLYLSPERLETDIIRTRIKKMKVNLIAVDEAHCISQWGYDFRPPYLRIADIRAVLPNVSILALTATATPKVVEDIQDKLSFKQRNVFQKSFERKNLIYAVVEEEDKYNRLIRIARKVKGSGIVYVRNRRRTKEIADFFKKNGIMADYYHAGLDPEVRDVKQNKWINNNSRIMVSTNAFGMGIDKSDVRFVVHIDLPDCLEAYFQEAGRGGRDEEKAYALLLFNKADAQDARKFVEQSYPDLELIKEIYNALGNYFQLAISAGKDTTFDFDISDFSNRYNLKAIDVYNSLKFLEKEGYLAANESLNNPSKIVFKVNREDLYKFQVKNKYFDLFIKTILRSYGGVFTDFVKIDEKLIASRLDLKKEVVVSQLQRLHKFGLLEYIPQNKSPQIVYLTDRLEKRDIKISPENYEERKNAALERIYAMINYATSNNKCRSQILLAYFGEEESKRCGNCDVCLERNKLELSRLEFDQVLDQIKPLLMEKPFTIEGIVNEVKRIPENKTLKVIQWLLDNKKVYYNRNNELTWIKK